MGSNRSWKHLLIAGAVFASLGLIPALRAQDSDAAFRGKVQPFLAKHCISCHNAKLKTANLDLSSMGEGSKQVEIWAKVHDKLSTGKMPPVGLPAPSKAEVADATQWIDAVLAKSGVRRDDPGRVMARRLNRTEYNNTVRDLLGIAFRPADEFPVDDSGYGFDNIADVLTVSPLLMEKYLTAARKASKLAVFGDTWPAKPVLISHQLAKRSYDVSPSNTAEAGASYLPYSMRGNLSASFIFPVDAEYELRFRVMNLRNANNNNQTYLDVLNGVPGAARPAGRGGAAAGRGGAGRGGARGRGGSGQPRSQEDILGAVEKARLAAPPVKVLLLLDGEPVLNDVIEGDTNYGYARGEFVAKVPVKAGEHQMRVSFPELADLPDPRLHLNIDQRRKIFVDYLDVVGPFNPSKAPPASYKQIFMCGHEPGKHVAACGRQVLSNLMLRAYRRPPLAAEVDEKLRLVAVARKEGDSFEEGIRLAIEAILASPNFLLKLERDPKASTQAAHLISDYELATRLSYFLWASMPDAELFRAAQARTLRNPGVLAAQVRRMMADPKAGNLVENFAAQWLQLRNLGRTKPDGARFGKIDDELIADMKTETNLFVQEIIREDRSILDFIDAPFTYLNGPLARHYGITGVDGEEFRRVELKGEQRGGLLGQAAILTVSSYPTRTSIPVRGKWVLENLLGTPPPPPPADVPVLDESKIGTTVSLRERFEQHRADPNCSGCHSLMDPIGFGLESYDAVGTWRTHDGQVPLDTSGVLPDGRTFKGAMGLKQLLKTQTEAFTRNLAEKLLTFALGRGLESSDNQAVSQIVKQTAANNFKFSTLILEAVNSKPFQMRSALNTKVAQGVKP